jgi:cephalosporin-C deacetylase-like acetyl esterase
LNQEERLEKHFTIFGVFSWPSIHYRTWLLLAAPKRICAFGKSRGGRVALLAAIRDSRIKLVLDWAGSVD